MRTLKPYAKMKYRLMTWMIAPALMLNIQLNAQVKTFDPLGKTEEEITAQWGAPTGRMDLGSESQLEYSKGRVIFEEGKAVKFKPAAGGASTTVKPSGGSSSSGSSDYGSGAASGAREKEEQALMLKRLENDLSEKRKELQEKENSKDKKEIQDRFEDAVKRLGANYYSSSNYTTQYNNLVKQKQDDLDQLERRQGLKQLKEDIQKLESDISDKRREIYR